ncbi:MAG: spore germination protein [Firmicutes bacterium]|nr:spore germination protein [Bacillota bacterium]
MKSITSRQFAIAAFLVIMAQKIFLLPTMMVKTGGASGYISVIFVLALELAVLLLIMFTIKMQPNRSLYNLLDKGAGKVGGRIIAALMLFCLSLKLMLLVSEIRVFFNINLQEGLSEWVAQISAGVFLFAVGTKTLRGIGRLAEITAPFILGVMVLMFLLVVGNVQFDRLLPVLSGGFAPILKNMSLYPLWFGDIPYMLIFLGQIKKDKRFFLYAPVGAGLGAVIALFFSSVLFMAFGGIPHLLDYGNNISTMLFYSATSYMMGRFDLILFSVWIFTLFIQFALVFYFLTRNLKYIFGANGNRLVSLAGAIVVFTMATFIFTEEYPLYYFCTQPIVRFAALFNNYLVPLFVFLIAVVLKIRQNKRVSGELLQPIFSAKIKQRSRNSEA